uniref:Uncharacterized protein n=1 Tax=Alexandrium catenella TaxID=2925 RepID=A0A7S1S275_ALECA
MPKDMPAAPPAQREGCCFTFAVEPGITPAGPGSFGADRRRFREPEPPVSLEESWRRYALASPGGSIEAMSAAPAGVVATFTKQNLFAKAVHAAFYGHHPLVLSPDVIWLTIAQGLAHHVDQNAQALRERFVAHAGKEEIVVVRPGFVKGSADNDWEGVFPDFAAQIAERTVGDVARLVMADFSTTGPAERIASQVTLMDTVQHYFSYTMCCGCGFPSIALRGTAADWEALRAKAERLRAFDLDWWLAALLPALDHFVEAAHGRPDLDFWRALCNINVGTSFPCFEPLTGWVQAFFPYLLEVVEDSGFGFGSGGGGEDAFRETDGAGTPKRKMRRNTLLGSYAASAAARVNLANAEFGGGSMDARPPPGTERGVKIENFPPAMSSAPFTYKDEATGKSYKMAFFGGINALVQHADGAIEPTIGWAVLDQGPAAAC